MKSTTDNGSDPLGNGQFRMVPSGDIVDLEERNLRLERFSKNPPRNECMGMSWEEIALQQGGLQTLDITRTKKR